MNGLLAALPEHEYALIAEHLEAVFLTKGQDLFLLGETPPYIYCPTGAMVSVMMDMADGFSVETYMLGNASLVGHFAMTGASFYRANVRTSGWAYRLPVQQLRRLLPDCPVHCQTSAQTLGRAVAQLSQAIVCGKHHSVEQQLLRWLLITLDRTLMPSIDMTHQEISERLGFRREAITVAVGKLMERGYIQVRRGTLEVIDRQALEAQVCDCYWIGQGKIKPDFSKPWRRPDLLNRWLRRDVGAGA